MLLVRSAQADGAAFRRLYELQSATLYSVALRITRQPAMAADAVHDALLQVWRNAARFDPQRGNARAWLLSIVRYRAMDAIRRHAKEIQAVDGPEPPSDDPDPLDRLTTTLDGQALHRCLQQVSADRRSLVVMAFVDGLTHAEVATRIGQPLGTVKSTIRRVLLSLRTCLGAAA